jgi:hypothetical protein
VLALTIGFSQPANAQTGDCGWIDAKTGQPYPSGSLVPLGIKEINFQADPNHLNIALKPKPLPGRRYRTRFFSYAHAS